MLTLINANICRLLKFNKTTKLQHNGKYLYRAVPRRQYAQAEQVKLLPENQQQAYLGKKQKSQKLLQSVQQPSQVCFDSDRQTDKEAGNQQIMNYDIDWIFPRMQRPSKLWRITSQLVITVVGLLSKIALVFLNKTYVYNKDRLVNLIANRPKNVPLLTISNHHSCFDDPGLWGVLPLRYLCNTLTIRWSLAAHDICFTNKLHSAFFMFGKCIPVVRGNGVYQKAVDICIEKCALGDWVHIFPEGKVNMSKEEIRLKWGIGRIIYESPKIPIILPMWHEGMDEVLPNVEPYILQRGKHVTLNIGEPLDLNDFITNLKKRKVPEPEARKLITDELQRALRRLRLETEEMHKKRLAN